MRQYNVDGLLEKFGNGLITGVLYLENTFERATKYNVFFVIGTSALGYPAAALPEAAKRSGTFLIEVNPEETPLTKYCDKSFRENADEIMPLSY